MVKNLQNHTITKELSFLIKRGNFPLVQVYTMATRFKIHDFRLTISPQIGRLCDSYLEALCL
jgi:hypothetical protein